MKIKYQIAFWVIVYLLFITIYTDALSTFSLSLFFVTMLYPVVLGTALFFNHFLVPNYLLKQKVKSFFLYAIYSLIGSVFLELIVIFAAFAYLAELQVQNMNPMILDVTNMVMVMYAVVFAHGFLLMIRKYQASLNEVAQLESEKEKARMKTIHVRSDRQNRQIELSDINYLESLSDYVKIHLKNESAIITKQKISSFEENLPDTFVRIHRSFIVNSENIKSYTKEKITINGDELPVSRTYKNAVRLAFERKK